MFHTYTTIPYLTVFLHKCGYLSLFGAFLRYVCSAYMVGDISYGAAPTSAVYCYYSFAVDMNSFFSAAMDASAPQ